MKLLTVKETAKILNCSQKTVLSMITKNSLKAYRISDRKILIDVEKFLGKNPNDETSSKKMLSVQDTAEILNCERKQIYVLINDYKLPVRRLSQRKIYINRWELCEWIRKREIR